MADEATEEIQVAENAQTERPDWLPSNFESPEMLAKSWGTANEKIREQGTELAAMRAQMEEIQAAQQSTQQQTYVADIEQRLYDAYESGDGRAIAAANAYLIKQAVEQQSAALTPTQQQSPEIVAAYAESEVAREFADWPEYRAKAGEVIAANPALAKALEGETSPRIVAEHLKTAYKLAKFESGHAATARAEQDIAEINRQVKNQAQTMAGSNSTTEETSYFDRVKAAGGGNSRFGV